MDAALDLQLRNLLQLKLITREVCVQLGIEKE